jgi:hypothetical protein
MNKTYVFDLDGTICEEKRTFERCLAKPNTNVIKIINELFLNNNAIIIYTARGWSEFEMTKRWLEDNNVKYNLLMCGKIIYDHWIDDRAINIKDFIK